MGRRRWIAWAAPALALGPWLCVAPARADNGIAAITVQLERGLTSVAVKAIVQGDDDSSAVLRIFQRWRGASTYDTGMVMVRRIHGPLRGIPGPASAAAAGEIFEGRILRMATGRTVDFYVEGIDDGGSRSTKPDTVSCKRMPLTSDLGGPRFYVSAGSGSDGNPGTSALPVRTINRALDLLSASPNEGRNGGVVIGPGIYHEQLVIGSPRFPTDGYPHFISGDGTNRDSTILCGANEMVEQGKYDATHSMSWTATGQDSTYKCYFPAATGPGDSVQFWMQGYKEVVHRKTSLKAVLDDSTWIGAVSIWHDRERSGWYWQNDTLYMKFRDGSDPSGQLLFAGYRDNLIHLKRRNWMVKNLTLRFSGGLKGDTAYAADPDPGMQGHGITAGWAAPGQGTTIDSCRVYGTNSQSIYLQAGSIPNGWLPDSSIIANCIIDNRSEGGWPYSASKARDGEDAGEVAARGHNMSIISNQISECHNGIGWDSLPSGADSTVGSAIECVGNTFNHIVDDAIEMDNSHGINVLVQDNTITFAGDGFSVCPTWTGPMFVFYNTVANNQGAFNRGAKGVKGGNGNTGIVHFVHNTFTSSAKNFCPVNYGDGGDENGRYLYVNNILASHAAGYVVRGPAAPAALSSASLSTPAGMNFNLVTGAARLATWGGRIFADSTAVRTIPWETNGRPSGVLFADSSRADWSQARASGGLAKGRRWTGVNTGLDGNRYPGRAPAIGARESGN